MGEELYNSLFITQIFPKMYKMFCLIFTIFECETLSFMNLVNIPHKNKDIGSDDFGCHD